MAENNHQQQSQADSVDEPERKPRAARKRAAKKPTAKKSASRGGGSKKQSAKKTPAKKETKAQGAKKSQAKNKPRRTTQAKSQTKKSPEKKNTKPQAVGAAQVDIPEENARLAARLDRGELAEKVRVHALAKMIGLPSRELVAALGEIGIKKVAQSSLTREETDAILDAVTSAEPTPTPAGESNLSGKEASQEAERDAGGESQSDTEAKDDRPAEDDGLDDAEREKIRRQVENNVANEINQLESKIDHQLEEEARTEQPEEEPDEAEEAEPTAETEEDERDDRDGRDSEPTRRRRRVASRRGRRGSGRGRKGTAPADEAPEDHPDEHQFDRRTKQNNNRKGKDERSRRPKDDRGDKGNGGRGRKPKESAVEHALDDSRGELPTEPVALKGSTRLEAKRRRRSAKNDEARKRQHVLTEEEFLARRESVKREMIVRERQRHDHPGSVVQVGVLEDELLVEHFVTSDTQSSSIGNLYLGRVQNVLPSMEAAFIDIGQGRNGVLYAGEVDWRAAGLGGRSRRIEQALKSGDQVVVQVTKDPMGHKGARLTTQVSLAGRYLVYVPEGRSAGISRKLPAPERARLKKILKRVMPERGGAIIRTAAEGVSEEAIAADVRRLHRQWEDIQDRAKQEKKSRGSQPVTLYEEPPMLVKVVRDLFNEDFTRLVVDGDKPWNTVSNYVESVAPDLMDRLEHFHREEHGGRDAFEVHRVGEQIDKALARVVYLPSGGSLVIDRTEAMTVIDVNTGRFTGSGGNLEETVTSNNLEAAEEIVRQLRLRDIGGMIVIDFIDMVLPENRELVLRRLAEALSRDRTRHQISEVTSLGLVQVTRKRLGTGLVETFSTRCECCRGRGIIIHDDPVEDDEKTREYEAADRSRKAARDTGDAPDNRLGAKRQGRNSRRGHDDGRHDAPQDSTNQAANEAELEKLAASVIAMPEEEDRGHGDHDDDDRRENRRRGRGRRRRGSRRGGGRNRDRDRDCTRDVDTARQADTSGDTEVEHETEQPGLSYEEAVARFERSPRRKRRTRGNSRSDRRPRPEDFRSEKREDRDASDEHDDARDEHGLGKPAEPTADAVAQDDERTGRGRGRSRRQAVADHARAAGKRPRRRAVRRAARRATDRDTAEAPRKNVSQRRGRDDADKQERPARSESPAQRGTRGGRSRRRAARRTGRG